MGPEGWQPEGVSDALSLDNIFSPYHYITLTIAFLSDLFYLSHYIAPSLYRD